MLHSKPTTTAYTPNTRLTLTDGTPLMDPPSYHNLVGILHYITFTRLNLSFFVHQVCQFMSSPTTIHLAAAKRILRYMRGTLYHGLAITPGPLSLSDFIDVDWARNPSNRHLVNKETTYCLTLFN